MEYPLLTIKQASQLHALQTVMIAGRIRYSDARVYLEQADRSLRLIGQPFSGLLLPGQHVEVWGELLLGKMPVLLVHDARPTGDTLRQPQVTPSLKVGQSVLMPLVRVLYHADEQVALTPDGQQIILHGEELDQRCYAVELQIISLNPPVAMIQAAVPVSVQTWSQPGSLA